MRKWKQLWHRLHYQYYHQLKNDCLDPFLKMELMGKVYYHKKKLENLSTS